MADAAARRRTLDTPTALAVARYLLPLGSPLDQPLSLVTVGGVTAPVPAPTGADLVATVIAYGYVIVAFAVLASFLLDPANVYRKQTGAVVASGVVPFLGDVFFTTGRAVHPGLSLAPALLVVHSFIIAVVLFRYDGHSITASAGDVLVEEIPDPVVVLDDHSEELLVDGIGDWFEGRFFHVYDDESAVQ